MIFCIFSSAISGQKTNVIIDSLQNLLADLNQQGQTFINDTSRIKNLNLLASKLITAGDLIKGDSLARQVLLIAEKGLLISEGSEVIAYKKGMARAFRNRGNAAFYQENYNASIDFYSNEVTIYESFLAGDKLPEAFKKNISSDLAKVLGNIGNVYSRLDNYSKALENYYRSLKFHESLGDKKQIGWMSGNIGIIYYRMQDLPKALEFYQIALKISQKQNSRADEGRHLANIGMVYSDQKNYVKGLEYLTSALKLAEEEKDFYSETSILSAIGNVYGEIGNYEKAFEAFNRGLKIAEENDDKGMISNLNGNIGEILMRQNELKEAEGFLLTAFVIAKEIGELYEQKEASLSLSELYRKLNNTDLAFNYYDQYSQIKDSIYNRENSMNTLRMEMNYEYEKKEAKEKAEHEKIVIALEAENQLQQNTRNYIVLLAILSLLLVASGFVYFNNRKSMKLKELYSQQVLLSQEKERQRISKELHDSIGQNILFIKNQMIKNNDTRLMSSVDETLEEVRNISKDLYPNQLEKYGLIAAVDALAEKAKESSNVFVSYDLDAIDKNISADKQINYYRIIQECITNALKHADATALRISASKTNGSLEIVVQDNGKGFDKEVLSKKAQRSFGLLNLEERAKHLKGKLVLETSPGKGTKYIFSMPT